MLCMKSSFYHIDWWIYFDVNNNGGEIYFLFMPGKINEEHDIF